MSKENKTSSKPELGNDFIADVIHSDSFRKDLNDAYLFYKENVINDNEILSAQQFLDIYTIGYKKAVKNHCV